MEILGSMMIFKRSSNKKNELFLPGGGQKICCASGFFGVFSHSPIAPTSVSRNAHPPCARTPTLHARTPTPGLCAHAPTPTPTPTHNAHTHTRSGTHRHTHRTSHTHTHRSRPHHAHITRTRTFLLSFRMLNLCSTSAKNHLFSNVSKNSQKKMKFIFGHNLLISSDLRISPKKNFK